MEPTLLSATGGPPSAFPAGKNNSGKAVWNPSKLGMRSLWECHVPPKVPRLCWKQDHDLPELQKTEGERDWSIIPAGWNHWESKADAWLKSWRYTIYYKYKSSDHQPPVFFLEEMAGYLLYTEIFFPVKPWFFQNSPKFFQSSNWTPNLLLPIFFWGLKEKPCPPRKKQVKTHEAKCLVGSPWCLSDVGHPSKLGALDLGSYMAFGGFERPEPGDEELSTWRIHIYIYT